MSLTPVSSSNKDIGGVNQKSTSSIIIIYFENIIFFHAQPGLDVWPDKKFLHIFRNTTQSHMSTHCGTIHFFHFMWCDAPQPIRMGESSLNLAPAHLTLALATLLLHQVCHPFNRIWVYVPTLHWVESQLFQQCSFNRAFSPNIPFSVNQHYFSTSPRCHYIFH